MRSSREELIRKGVLKEPTDENHHQTPSIQEEVQVTSIPDKQQLDGATTEANVENHVEQTGN